MAKASKLSSGAWRVQATKVINGKKIKKSFSVHPKEFGGDWRKAKSQAELLAREWQLEASDASDCELTIEKILKDYILDRSKILSPRTIYDYNRLVPYFDKIKDIYMDDLKTSHIQTLVNEWAVSVTAKTIQNRLSLILSALDYAGCDRKFKIRMPQKRPKKILSPDIQDIYRLLDNATEEFKPIIALAAFGSLRRGEIAALKESDISWDMRTIFVHADMVQTENGFFYKDIPKTSGSVRVIDLSPETMSLLPRHEDPDAYVFGLNPTQIGKRYSKLRKACGIDSTFHSLRHFAASYRSDIGIPRKYIEEVGGWVNESVILQRTYDNTLESSRRKYVQMSNDFIKENFAKVLKTS